MLYQAVAVLPGGWKKAIVNKTGQHLFTNVVLSFVSVGVVEAKWGKGPQR